MKIIEIKQTRNGEVAYVLDEVNGRVLRMPVVDYPDDTSAPRPKRPMNKISVYDDGEEYEDEIPQPRRRIQRLQNSIDIVSPIESDETPIPPAMRPPMKRNIMPPGMSSIFTPAGQPGEALETRNM